VCGSLISLCSKRKNKRKKMARARSYSDDTKQALASCVEPPHQFTPNRRSIFVSHLAWVENGANSEPNSTVANLIDDLAIAGETCYAWKQVSSCHLLHLSNSNFSSFFFFQLKKLVAWKLRSTITTLTKDKPISEVIDGVPFDKRYGSLFTLGLRAFRFTLRAVCRPTVEAPRRL